MIVEFDKELFNEMLLKMKELIEVVRARQVADTFDLVMNTIEAMLYLGVSIRTLQLFRDNGVVKFSQYGKIIWYRKEDLDQLILDHRVGR